MKNLRPEDFHDYPYLTLSEEKGITRFGIRYNAAWHEDPRQLLFVLSRYKFVAKMLSGKQRVLEVGCGDAFCTRVVLQEVESVVAVDRDPYSVDDAHSRMEQRWAFECRVHDILSGPVNEGFDAAYAIDVLEHIPREQEGIFISNISHSLDGKGVLIIGLPSTQSQIYASEGSKAGHINCKDATQLRALMQDFFHNVFVFSMNDEVIHTGFHPMANYLFALAVGKRAPADVGTQP